MEFLHRMTSLCKPMDHAISDVMKSCLTCVYDMKIRNGYIKWETTIGMSCVHTWYWMALPSASLARQNAIAFDFLLGTDSE